MLKKTSVKAVKAAKPRTKVIETPPAGISDNSAKAISEALNGILADSFALYLKTKNFHWHVSGPHFREYHLLFDAQATQIFATTDAIAERVRKVGGTTLRSIGDIASRQRITDNNAENVSAAAMIKELHQDNLKLVAALREAKELVDDAKDNATSGILDTWTDEAEERAWFLLETSKAG
jgi:starvation-inducible DNA-binding protein